MACTNPEEKIRNTPNIIAEEMPAMSQSMPVWTVVCAITLASCLIFLSFDRLTRRVGCPLQGRSPGSRVVAFYWPSQAKLSGVSTNTYRLQSRGRLRF